MESEFKLPESLQEAVIFFSDVGRAHQYAVSLRWPRGISCPRCGFEGYSFISTRRIYFCKGCKKQFTVKVGTIFEDSPLGMDKWMMAVWLIVTCKNGISSYELASDLNISQKSAWHMLHRIRAAMASGSFEKKMSGEVEADESFIGGKVKNMHQLKKIRKYVAGDIRHGGYTGKAIIMGLLERHSKEIRARVLPELRKANIDEHIDSNVEHGTTIYTDDAQHYQYLPNYVREFVDHTEEYVRGAVHTNGLENFWSLLKRSLAGTYVSVEPYHLQAYVDEQAYRFNNRKDTPAERFADVMANVFGKRLTWNELTGKVMDHQSPIN